ncbi:MAG: hypothetical protein HY078_14835 [Elusimicrobia bacterium]|nr:hypothetical protein [Elusimicrobiota bacterium]
MRGKGRRLAPVGVFALLTALAAGALANPAAPAAPSDGPPGRTGQARPLPRCGSAESLESLKSANKGSNQPKHIRCAGERGEMNEVPQVLGGDDGATRRQTAGLRLGRKVVEDDPAKLRQALQDYQNQLRMNSTRRFGVQSAFAPAAAAALNRGLATGREVDRAAFRAHVRGLQQEMVDARVAPGQYTRAARGGSVRKNFVDGIIGERTTVAFAAHHRATHVPDEPAARAPATRLEPARRPPTPEERIPPSADRPAPPDRQDVEPRPGVFDTDRTGPALGPAAASTRPRIVMLGDSLSTRYFGFGPTMYNELTQGNPDARVQVYAYGASAPRHFLPGTRPFRSPNVYTPGAPNRPDNAVAPKLNEVLGPDAGTVVVALGTNLIDFRGIKNWQPSRPGERFDPSRYVSGLDEVDRMARQIHANGSNLIWVGPPDMRGFRGTDQARVRAVLQYIDSSFAQRIGDRGTYIPSSTMTRYEGNDGIHQSAAAGTAWARALLADPRFRVRN